MSLLWTFNRINGIIHVTQSFRFCAHPNLYKEQGYLKQEMNSFLDVTLLYN
jgi:hypothetical protein